MLLAAANYPRHLFRSYAGKREPPSFEMLYEVTGYGRTNLDAMLVHTAALNYRQIWGGVLRQPPMN